MARSRRAARATCGWGARRVRFASPRPIAAVAMAATAPSPGDWLVTEDGGCCIEDDESSGTPCAWVPVELGTKAGPMENAIAAEVGDGVPGQSNG
mmetsp:Transcript_27093/g.77734  ORF Transcript_27093/g.77734 Transcript_27093/m.77734 type:complete len:95 (-) Transcript_27093:23-307(-)